MSDIIYYSVSLDCFIECFLWLQIVVNFVNVEMRYWKGMLMKAITEILKFRQQVMIRISLMPNFYTESETLSSEGHIYIHYDVH